MNHFRWLFALFLTLMVQPALAADFITIGGFTVDQKAIKYGQTVHISATFTANVALTQAGNVHLYLFDANNQRVKDVAIGFQSLKAGQVLKAETDFTPTNVNPQGNYTLQGTAWSPVLNGFAQQYGAFTVAADVPFGDPKKLVALKSIGADKASVAQGQTLTYQATLTPARNLPSAGYVILGIYDAKNVKVREIKKTFYSLIGGTDVVTSETFDVPTTMAPGKYSLLLNGWSPEISAYQFVVGAFTVTPQVIGACGAGANVAVPAVPTTGLCGTGTASGVALGADNIFRWSCDGSTAKLSAVCSAPKQIVKATCGDSNGKALSFIPAAAGLCAKGTAGAVVLTAKGYGWSCADTASATTATCAANYIEPLNQVGASEGPFPGTAATLAQFEKFLGRPVDLYADNINQSDWSQMMMNVPWLMKAVPTDKRITVALPMLVANDFKGTFWADGVQYKDANYPKGTLQDGADGKLDQYFIFAAQTMIKYGHGNAIVRLGWEMNGNWQPWRAAANPTAYKAFFKRIVTLMRAVPGAAFQFDWNPNLYTHEINPELAYPGDDVVDYIGLDVYDEKWNSTDADPATRWNMYMNNANGIAWWIKFANAHNKKKSLPEWGGGNTGGHGGGDNALFIRNMGNVIKNNAVSYAIYWDRPDAAGGKLSTGQFPLMGAEYQTQFGGARK